MNYLQKWWDEKYPNAAIKKIEDISDGIIGIEHLIDFEQWMIKNKSETKKVPINTPKSIFLNIGFNKSVLDETQFDFNDLKEVTWSKERISDNDIEYTY